MSTLTAALAADAIAAYVGLYRQANDAFRTSAITLAQTLDSGVKVADVKREVKARNLPTYGSDAALHYHALTGRLLMLPDGEGEALPVEVTENLRDTVQSVIAALYNNGCSREVRAIVKAGKGQASTYAALIAANDARIAREVAAIDAPNVPNVPNDVPNVPSELTDAPTDARKVRTAADLLTSMASIASGLGEATATADDSASALALAELLMVFAESLAVSVPTVVEESTTGAHTGTRVSGRIVKPRAPRNGKVVTTAVA